MIGLMTSPTLMRPALAAALLGLGVTASLVASPALANPSDPGVVSYAVLGKGSVGNIVGAHGVGVGVHRAVPGVLG